MRLQALTLLLVSLFFVKFAQAQSDELVVQGQTGKYYLLHTVAPKENWYSVGRLYNISPKVIAPFNNLAMTQPLSIGQQLQIPLSAANFSQNGQKTAAETLVPIYHIVQDKEWMYRLSVNYKVPIPTLEKWNNMSKDQVKAGMHLIVGYLKVNTAQSALASGLGKPAVAGTVAPPVSDLGTGKPVTEKAAGTDKTAGTEKPVGTEKTVIDKPAATDKTATTDKTVNMDKPVVVEKPVVTAVAAPPKPKPVAPAVSAPAANPTINFNGGYFKSEFSESGKAASGQAGVFKSTSGWQDGKYYALMNNVPVGTIVKISNSASGRAVYAKILGQLPDMKESAGLTVRLSNAAAAELGQNGEGHFNVDVKY